MINTLEELFEALRKGEIKGGYPVQAILNSLPKPKAEPEKKGDERI